ncbi:MAG: hypothetical protein SWE60_24410, partial [Thermodesulfobacteriota bacterium]|nr:hypothetical protein [Thermodesulfobacteriota bacterium]
LTPLISGCLLFQRRAKVLEHLQAASVTWDETSLAATRIRWSLGISVGVGSSRCPLVGLFNPVPVGRL